MALDLLAIIILGGLVFSLISIFIGIWTMIRTSGKLRNVVVLLIMLSIIIGATGFLRLTGFVAIENSESAGQIVNVVVTFFILIALLNMKQMIDVINHNHGK